MRIIMGGCYGEVHTFLAARTEFHSVVGHDIVDEYRDTRSFIGAFIDGAEEAGVELIPAVFSSVGASPLPTAASYASAKKEMLDCIAAAGKIDGVLLNLHGSLAVEGMTKGVESDYVRAIRSAVGPDVPIVCTADPHGNVSQAWVDAADAIVANNSIPEIDGYERGLDALEILVDAVRDDLRPVMALGKPGMLTPTGVQMANYPGMKPEYPMAKVWKVGFHWEAVEDVLKVNVFPGFFREDVENAGASVVVVTDDDRALAERAVEDVARVLWDAREGFWLDFKGPEEAVRMAMEAGERPVVLHNPEDDPAGGAPADGTEILKTLLELGAEDAAIWLHDAEAVGQAVAAGVGNPVKMPVGGKLIWRHDGKHPEPVTVEGTVKLISDGRLRLKGPMGEGTHVNMGRTAVIDTGGVDVVISEDRRAPTFDPELYRSVGIEPTDKEIVVIKQTHHWRAAYETIVAGIISVTCPNDYGVGSGPINRLTGEASWPYENVQRPIWPLDEDAELWF